MHVEMLKRNYFAAELKQVLWYIIPTHLVFCFVDLALNLGHLSAVSIDGGLDVPGVWLGGKVYRDIYIHVRTLLKMNVLSNGKPDDHNHTCTVGWTGQGN